MGCRNPLTRPVAVPVSTWAEAWPCSANVSRTPSNPLVDQRARQIVAEAMARRAYHLAGTPRTTGSALDKGLFDDEVTGRRMIALDEAALVEDGAEVRQHRGTAAQHDAIDLDVERRHTTIRKQLARRDQIGDA